MARSIAAEICGVGRSAQPWLLAQARPAYPWPHPCPCDGSQSNTGTPAHDSTAAALFPRFLENQMLSPCSNPHRLQQEPDKDTTISLTPTQTDLVSVTPQTLTFTRSNWRTPQFVSVTAGTLGDAGSRSTQEASEQRRGCHADGFQPSLQLPCPGLCHPQPPFPHVHSPRQGPPRGHPPV